MSERTLPALFEESARRFPKNPLVWEKRDGRYQAVSYEEMRERVRDFSAGLYALGLRRGDRAALISEGRADWVMSELGIVGLGAVNVPISIKVEELSDLKFRLAHSGTSIAVVSKGQVEKIRRVKKDLAELRTIVVLDPLPAFEADEIYAGDVLAAGRTMPAERGAELEAARAALKESDAANICYTSGTTADPKGIVLTHRNYTANVEQCQALVPCPERYLCLIILPWDHAFGHTAGIYTLMKSGAAMAAMESLRALPDNIKETRPTILLSAPALAKSFRKGIEKAIRDKGPAAEALFRKALRLAYGYNAEGWNKGRGYKKLQAPLLAIYDRLLFRKIRASFGGRLEFFVGGAALLDIELQRFFYAIGIPMLQGYGLTEAAPVISANNLTSHKLGSSGRVAPGIELRIRDEEGRDLPAGAAGEIVIRGENVMAGYWRNEKATRETLRDGWLYTGDLGSLDADGFLYVHGRAKSLLIGNDGDKYSPEGIEEAITDHSPYIDQLMLYNNQSPYTVALLVPNREALVRRLGEMKLAPSSPEGQEAALRLLQAEIDAYREGGRFAGMFPTRWLPTAVAVLGEGFTEPNRLLNSTLKMVRGRIVDYYRIRLDYLFTAEARDIVNPQNRTIVGRLDLP